MLAGDYDSYEERLRSRLSQHWYQGALTGGAKNDSESRLSQQRFKPRLIIICWFSVTCLAPRSPYEGSPRNDLPSNSVTSQTNALSSCVCSRGEEKGSSTYEALLLATRQGLVFTRANRHANGNVRGSHPRKMNKHA